TQPLAFGGWRWESPELLPWQPRPWLGWPSSAVVASIHLRSRRLNRRPIRAAPRLATVVRTTDQPSTVTSLSGTTCLGAGLPGSRPPASLGNWQTRYSASAGVIAVARGEHRGSCDELCRTFRKV